MSAHLWQAAFCLDFFFNLSLNFCPWVNKPCSLLTCVVNNEIFPLVQAWQSGSSCHICVPVLDHCGVLLCFRALTGRASDSVVYLLLLSPPRKLLLTLSNYFYQVPGHHQHYFKSVTTGIMRACLKGWLTGLIAGTDVRHKQTNPFPGLC